MNCILTITLSANGVTYETKKIVNVKIKKSLPTPDETVAATANMLNYTNIMAAFTDSEVDTRTITAVNGKTLSLPVSVGASLNLENADYPMNATIEWTSSNSSVINTSASGVGVITQGVQDEAVIITATIKSGIAINKKTFKIIVKKTP